MSANASMQLKFKMYMYEHYNKYHTYTYIHSCINVYHIIIAAKLKMVNKRNFIYSPYKA
jgi:hypothetical protein